jgi:hypothetical protein
VAQVNSAASTLLNGLRRKGPIWELAGQFEGISPSEVSALTQLLDLVSQSSGQGRHNNRPAADMSVVSKEFVCFI